jgi:hypothetical protein
LRLFSSSPPWAEKGGAIFAFAHKLFGAQDRDHLNPERTQNDLNHLLEGAAPVPRYVDKFVAHSEYRGMEPAEVKLRFNDIHDAIDVIGELFQRYHLLFTAADMVDLVPVIQHDWLAPFRQPWIRHD